MSRMFSRIMMIPITSDKKLEEFTDTKDQKGKNVAKKQVWDNKAKKYTEEAMTGVDQRKNLNANMEQVKNNAALLGDIKTNAVRKKAQLKKKDCLQFKTTAEHDA